MELTITVKKYLKHKSEWELTSSTRRWAKDRTVISTARADYRSDLASSLVVTTRS
ncbi:hypothetical protein LMB30_09580 [Limosilactobacillus reuteri]|nr:hypothetical protein [Limosilactobacillus reuteri]